MRAQVSRSCARFASTSACFTAWAKCLQQRRFHSLSSAAEGVQRQMHSIEGMFSTQMSAVVAERDALQEGLRIELDKVQPSLGPQLSGVGLVQPHTRCCRWHSFSKAKAP